MLKEISWPMYFSGVAVVVGVYYLAVGVIYFRKELAGLLSGKFKENDIAGQPFFRTRSHELQVEQPSSNLQTITIEDSNSEASAIEPASELTDRLKTLLRVMKDNKCSKKDLLEDLQILLRQYPLLQSTKYRFSINSFIENYCKASFPFPLTIEEINKQWPDETSVVIAKEQS